MGRFYVDETAQATIRQLVDHAKANPFRAKEVIQRSMGMLPPISEENGFGCFVGDYSCVFAIEDQIYGPCRHLAIQGRPGYKNKVPVPDVVRLLMRYFGFIGGLDDTTIWVDGTQVNVIEPLPH